MLVSHKNRCLFFLAPKCGTSTIRKRLKNFFDASYKNHFSPELNREIMGHHVTYSEWLSVKNKQEDDGYYKFSFVRNPYDRIYSAFRQDKYASENIPK